MMDKSRWYGRVPITITLAAAIGFLVLLTAGIVFAVGVWLAQKNTFALISENAHLSISADVYQIEQHLSPAERQTQAIAQMIGSGDIDPANNELFGSLLIGALASVPQIDAVLFINKDNELFGAGRSPLTGQSELNVVNYVDDPLIEESMVESLKGPLWLQPIWREQYRKTFISRVHPVELDGENIGAVVAVVSVEELSEFISLQGTSSNNVNRFILYGEDQVLAHWLLVNSFPGMSAESPLPRRMNFSDPILASMWQSRMEPIPGLSLPEGTEGRSLEALGENYAVFYKLLPGYGPEALIVGTYFQSSDRPEELERLAVTLVAGLIALTLSLVAAIYLGRRIARPIVKFSAASSRIRDLEIARVSELPSSIIKELNDQSTAFNAMLGALRWFEMYVPKKIVKQLIVHGDILESQSATDEVTVMFTDVVGFSTLSEGMRAEELAAFVNQHFALVVDCIEAENGTVDKFMGDAVMAFWHGDDSARDTAMRACRAAIAISDAIRLDNTQRQKRADPPIRIRIGIHTGIATVGNIGAPGRYNYTIIGDSVNIGQRLEQLGKTIGSSTDSATILISGDTARKLNTTFVISSVGNHKLKGRVGPIEVFTLKR